MKSQKKSVGSNALLFVCMMTALYDIRPTSAATAFHTTKVTSSLWGFFITGLIFEAAIFSRALPLFRRISISTRSMDMRPKVKPDMMPAIITRPIADNRKTRYSAFVNS